MTSWMNFNQTLSNTGTGPTFGGINRKLPTALSAVYLVDATKSSQTFLTTKRCVREALGQLLEYAHYSDENNATKFVVIADAKYENNDIVYMKNLRARYQLPIDYRQWIWGKIYYPMKFDIIKCLVN